MAEQHPQVGHKIMATIKDVKVDCGWGHKVGDSFEVSGHNTGNMCGFFYHDIFPYITMLQFGGGFPEEWGGGDAVELECMDRYNVVKVELRRVS